MPDGIEHVRAVMSAPEDIDQHDDLQSDDAGADDGRFDDVPPAPPRDEGEEPPERACAALPLNDFGNGQRFVSYFGADVIWVPRVGWFTWTGQVWKIDPDQIAARRLAQQISGRMDEEIRFLVLDDWKMAALAKKRGLVDQLALAEAKPGDPEAEALARDLRRQLTAIAEMEKTLSVKRREHRTFAKSTGNSGKIDALLKEGSMALAHDLDELDAADLDINTETGVLRFSNGPRFDVDLIPHERTHLMTKMMPVSYDPVAECPGFDAFFAEVQPDPEMREFILRWLGLSMTAIPVQMLAFWYGAGANGKSVLADLFARMLDGYAATAKIKSLTGVDRRGGGDATPDLMMLIGARFVRASEPKEGEPLQEDLIKELTGGEVMMVRALNENFVEFRPDFKLTISGNHKPVIRGTDDGIWRRMLLVPWDVQIPEHRRDKDLCDRLFETERPGILNRLADGLRDYLQGGLRVPEAVSDATREFREESDPVGTFLDHCCVVSGDGQDSIGSRELGEAFNYWLDDKGEGVFKPRSVAIKLKEKAGRWKSKITGRTFTARKSSTMAYDGIRFNDVFGDRWRNLPRDHRGTVLRGRTTDDAPRDETF